MMKDVETMQHAKWHSNTSESTLEQKGYCHCDSFQANI